MIATYSQLRTRVLALLDDPLQAVFLDPILLQGMGEAVDALQQAFVFYEIPVSKKIVTYAINAGVTNFSPADAGITDCGEIIELREKMTGSSDPYTHIWECDDLPQRPQTQILGNWEWRGDDFWFVGATSARTVWISYFSTIEQPTAIDSSPTPADGDLTFLSKYAAGVTGPRKGYDEISAVYMKSAVGSRYDEGIIGGELFRLCQPMVRSRQRVQVAPRPYSVIRRRQQWRRNVYVAAPAGGTGTAPNEYTSANGSVTGTIDGVNAHFLILAPMATVIVTVNGVTMTQGFDYTHVGNSITFLAGAVPVASSDPSNPTIITVNGWL